MGGERDSHLLGFANKEERTRFWEPNSGLPMSGARDGDDAMEFIEIMNATDGVADDDLDSDGISAPMEHAFGLVRYRSGQERASDLHRDVRDRLIRGR